MPKIISYTPAWLSRPSPGSQAFTAAPSPDTKSSKSLSQYTPPSQNAPQQPYYGPHRILAQRGTEIFTVVGNQIRWFDLSMVKNDWEKKTNHKSQGKNENERPPYRVLATPVYQQIRQLIVSPSGNFLAITTEHTAHIAILPDSSHLSAKNNSSLKLKTHQLGPTTHVLPQSPLASVLWHPLACRTTSSDCLVTVTLESVVRVWELDRSNSRSFDRPNLAIDLSKLVDGTSCDESFEPAGFGKTRGFTADMYEMQTAAACFGGQGQEEDDGWASMTLWIAMKNGDVYALCPLLPSKWSPTPTQIPSLSTSVVSRVACIEDGSLDPEQHQALQQQLDWVREIDDQEATDAEFSSRPSAPSAIPRLQGPFLFDDMWDEEDLEVSDIHVTAAKVNAEELLSGEEEDYADLEGMTSDRLSSTLVSLATTRDKVYICLELEGISGQWLPKTSQGAIKPAEGESKGLVLVDSVQLGSGEPIPHNSPSFTQDPANPYNLFLTSSDQIHFLSVSAWASRLEAELVSPVAPNNGLDFRLRVLCSDEIVRTEPILDVAQDNSHDSQAHLSNSLLIHESDFGYFLLTSSGSGPYAVTFDTPDTVSRSWVLERSRSNSPAPTPTMVPTELKVSAPDLVSHPPRSAYGPSPAFYESTAAPLKHFMSPNASQRVRTALKEEIRMSPNTLDLMTAAHRIFSANTSQLEQAAAELFRRCARLRDELGDQVRQMAELSERMHPSVSSSTPGTPGSSPGSDSSCEQRFTRAQDRQQHLNKRYEEVRRKVGQMTSNGKVLSEKEKAWIHEIVAMSSAVGAKSPDDGRRDGPHDETMEERFDTAKEIHDTLMEEADEAQKASQNIDWPSQLGSSLNRSTSNVSSMSRSSPRVIPPKLHRAKIEEAMQMVEREATVIDAVMARLERLS